jgi:Protein of unknown function (DUF2510)
MALIMEAYRPQGPGAAGAACGERAARLNVPGVTPINTSMNGAPIVNLVYLVVAIVIAIAAYISSESFKKKNGVTPWHWPSWLWAVVGFFSFILCLILFMIASRRTKPAIGPNSGTDGGFGPPISSPVLAQSFTTDAHGWGQPAQPVVRGVNDQGPQHGVWHADPTGRFASRYWNGTAWTEHVSDGNMTTTDPL